jgi:UDP-N-acetylmuramate: L-alanyl-gamma-D-glutamyl-meso-diaminopimelate ligase
LHTFSSLNEKFLTEYAGAMDNADEGIVFYSKHALELKRMPPLYPAGIVKGFKKSNLKVITTKNELEIRLKKIEVNSVNFLFMSSGDYEGMDILKTLDIK